MSYYSSTSRADEYERRERLNACDQRERKRDELLGEINDTFDDISDSLECLGHIGRKLEDISNLIVEYQEAKVVANLARYVGKVPHLIEDLGYGPEADRLAAAFALKRSTDLIGEYANRVFKSPGELKRVVDLTDLAKAALAKFFSSDPNAAK